MPDSNQSIVPKTECNLRADHYWIAQTIATCPGCGLATRLIAVALPPGHEVLELDDRALDDSGAVDTWAAANHAAILFHIAHLSENVQARMCATSETYQRDADAPAAEAGWINHCEQCGAPFNDQDLFCEPDGAFFPGSEVAARLIRLLSVPEPIAVQASGYTHEPQFFDSMCRL